MMAESERDNPGLVVMPPLLPLSALALAVVLEWLMPLGFLGDPWLIGWQGWLGIVLSLSGIGYALWAVSAFSEAGTAVEPDKPSTVLVTTGPYAYSRNPIYLGFLLIYLGIIFGFALEWGLFIFPLLWLALDRFVVVKEEAYLHRKFGADYNAFCQQTRRWF